MDEDGEGGGFGIVLTRELEVLAIQKGVSREGIKTVSKGGGAAKSFRPVIFSF